MKKKIDERIQILIDNCVKTNHRSLFLIIGDRGLYQVRFSSFTPITSLTLLFSSDRKSAHAPVKSACTGCTTRPLVLQERVGNCFKQEEANEADP